MTSGPSYGEGFISLSPRLEQAALSKINNALDQAFKDIKLDVDDAPLRAIQGQLSLVESGAEDSATAMAGMARSLGSGEGDARRLAGALGSTERNAEQVEGALRPLPRLLDQSEDEARRLGSALDRAGDATRPLGRVNGALAGLKSGLLGAAQAAVAFFGVRGIANQAQEAIESFTNLSESVNAVNVVFGTGADTIFEFSERVADSAGLAKSEFQQMATVLGAALQNTGLDAREAADQTVILTQRAADMASVLNTDVSEALGAIQSALRGETDPIEKFGVTLSAAAVDAEAAALGFSRVGGEFDATAKTATRLSLIMGQTQRFANDFANTSDTLANSQRRAQAASEDFRAEVGEALAPALVTITEIIPDIIEGLRQLVPSFAAGADSAAGFLEGIGDDGGAGLRQLGAEARVLGGTLGDVAGGIGDFFTVIGAKVAVQTEAADRAMARLAQRGARFELRDLGVRLARELDQGRNAVDAFAEAVTNLGANKEDLESFRQGFGDFAIQANLSKDELLAVTGELIKTGAAAGLSAEEISVLQVRFNALTNSLAPVGNEAAQAARAMAEMDRVLPPINRAIVEFVETADDSVPRISAAFSAIAAAGNPLAEALDPFKGATEQLGISADEYLANLKTQVEELANFDAGIIRLKLAGFDDLAADLDKKGPAAQKTLTEFLANLNEAAQAEALLEGQGTEAVQRVQAELTAALSDPTIPESLRAELVSWIEAGGIDSPAVLAAIEDGAVNAAQFTAERFGRAYGRETIGEIETRSGDISDAIAATFDRDSILTSEFLAELRATGNATIGTFVAGMYDRLSGETGKLRQRIMSTLDDAIERQSPPKLFWDAGVDSGEALWGGFKSVPLDFPTVDFRRHVGTLGVIEPDVAAGGSLIGSMTVNNPIGEPTEESVQAALIQVAVSPVVNRLVSAGSSR